MGLNDIIGLFKLSAKIKGIDVLKKTITFAVKFVFRSQIVYIPIPHVLFLHHHQWLVFGDFEVIIYKNPKIHPKSFQLSSTNISDVSLFRI